MKHILQSYNFFAQTSEDLFGSMVFICLLVSISYNYFEVLKLLDDKN